MNDVCARVHEIDEHRAKGTHTHYRIKKLTPLHIDTLQALNEAGEWVTSASLEKPINEIRRIRGAKNIRSGSISGRLSEMGRIKLVKMKYADVVVDAEVPTFRFRKTPVWTILEKGKLALELRRIPSNDLR